jgi:hypothetical protein
MRTSQDRRGTDVDRGETARAECILPSAIHIKANTSASRPVEVRCMYPFRPFANTESKNWRGSVSYSYARHAVVMLLVLHSAIMSAQSAGPHPCPVAVTKPRTAVCGRSCCRCLGDVVNSANPTAFVVQQPSREPDKDSKGVKDWIPLLQSIVWVILIGAVLIGWRKEISGILQERHFRLKAAGFEVEVLVPEQVTNPLQLDVVETTTEEFS